MTNRDDRTPLAALLAAMPAAQGERRKGRLHGSVVRKLRNLIVTGVLAPGTRLNERELCEQLDVSRTPVREAIKTLVQDGLLRAMPNQSPVVSELDPAEITDLIEVVVTIEGLAGELAARRATDEELAEIGLLHYQMILHHTRDELPGYFEANKAFHRRGAGLDLGAACAPRRPRALFLQSLADPLESRDRGAPADLRRALRTRPGGDRAGAARSCAPRAFEPRGRPGCPPRPC
jgi:DNA-binding transcriptional regulator YhcF (GntR family)